jgi:hypothetical protein
MTACATTTESSLVLKSAADRINELHGQIIGAVRLSLTAGIEIGGILHETKGSLPHGRWGAWLSSSVSFTDRTARRYMALHDKRDKLLNSDSVSDLSSAYQLLSDAPDNSLLTVTEKKRLAECESVISGGLEKLRSMGMSSAFIERTIIDYIETNGGA